MKFTGKHEEELPLNTRIKKTKPKKPKLTRRLKMMTAV